MYLSRLTWMSVLTAATVLGCTSRGNIETLETALRQQEDHVAELQEQLREAHNDLEVSRNEAVRLRQQIAENGQSALPPEHLENEFRAVGIRFNNYLTSGIDRDDIPGEETLSVLVYPHDEEGGLIKLPGSLEIKAVDVTAPDGRQEVGHWNYDAEQTRDAWHAGFLAAGYLFELPWQQIPNGSTITLHARFITTDGRQFDAVQPLKIQPPNLQNNLTQSRPQKVRVGKPPELSPAKDVHRKPSFNSVGQSEDEVEPLPDIPPVETSDRYREWEIPRYR